jgi:catechol 2,3-dioxygenase-like lactoylglutathione lyase family enzyme
VTADLAALCIDARDPAGLASFWAELLGWERVDETTLAPTDDTGFGFRFLASDAPEVNASRIHLHLTSAEPEQQEQTVARVLRLGGRHLDVGQLPEEGHVVLADPEGNELCVIEAGNRFLADCGFLGELACDGTRDVGLFWSAALGWPLVWDQDEETAIRSPHGGPIVAWGGPPLLPSTGRDRWHFDVGVGTDRTAGVERLVSLGATVVEETDDRVAMRDPDGTAFCVL